MESEFASAKNLMEKSDKILIISHRKPDGDTLGAACAMNIALKEMGKQTTLACIDKPSERFYFLPHIQEFVKEFDHKEYDLIIVVDSGAYYMTGYHEVYPDIWDSEVSVINIDHHASNDNFGDINIVDSEAATTTVILYRFFKFAGYKISPQIATCMLTGIYGDTGSFMHSNTTLEVFKIAEDLVSKGAKISSISKNLFKNNPVSTLKLWGRILSNIKVNDEGVAISVVTKKDYEECGATPDELSGVIDYLNAIPDTKFSVLLNEDAKGNVKGSFRTRIDDIDLSEIASVFGGGGHKKAAGFSLPGHIEKEIHWRIVPRESVEE